MKLGVEPFNPLMAPLRLGRGEVRESLTPPTPRNFLILQPRRFNAHNNIMPTFTVSHFYKHLNVYMRSRRAILSSRVNAFPALLFGDL